MTHHLITTELTNHFLITAKDAQDADWIVKHVLGIPVADFKEITAQEYFDFKCRGIEERIFETVTLKSKL